MTVCEIVPLHEVALEINSLIPEHYEEAKKEFDYEPVNIDWNYFMALSKQGSCFVVSLKQDEKIVGYSIYTLSTDPMRMDIKEANNICMYVMKKFRGIGTVKLLTRAKELLSMMGAEKIHYLVRSQKLSRLLKKMGYSTQETLWSVAA